MGGVGFGERDDGETPSGIGSPSIKAEAARGREDTRDAGKGKGMTNSPVSGLLRSCTFACRVRSFGEAGCQVAEVAAVGGFISTYRRSLGMISRAEQETDFTFDRETQTATRALRGEAKTKRSYLGTFFPTVLRACSLVPAKMCMDHHLNWCHASRNAARCSTKPSG